jgi:hypothetical protein
MIIYWFGGSQEKKFEKDLTAFDKKPSLSLINELQEIEHIFRKSVVWDKGWNS